MAVAKDNGTLMQEKSVYKNKEWTIIGGFVRANKRTFAWIMSTMIASAAIGIVWAYTAPEIYKSSSLLAPVERLSSRNDVGGSVGSLLGSIGGLENLNSRSQEQVEVVRVLESRQFFEDKLADHFIESIQHFTEGLNSDSLEVGYRRFRSDFVSVSRESRTGFITLTTFHYTSAEAVELNALIIREINEYFRTEDLKQSQASQDYLTGILRNPEVEVEIKASVSNLLESEIRKEMLASLSSDYVLRIIDRPFSSVQRDSPNRTRILLFSLFAGAFVGIALSAIFRRELRTL